MPSTSASQVPPPPSGHRQQSRRPQTIIVLCLTLALSAAAVGGTGCVDHSNGFQPRPNEWTTCSEAPLVRCKRPEVCVLDCFDGHYSCLAAELAAARMPCQTCDDASALLTQAPIDYIIDSIEVAYTFEGALELGLDLDGDGVTDNKLGAVLSGLDDLSGDPNEFLVRQLSSGKLVLAARLHIDQDLPDRPLLASFVKGASPLHPPTFDGHDEVRSATDWTANDYLCGELQDGWLSAGPGTVSVVLPIIGDAAPTVLLRGARLEGTVDASGWYDVVIGGGLDREQINEAVLPAMAAMIQDWIATHPGQLGSNTYLALFDHNCDEVLCPGSRDEPDCADDDRITLTELRCNMLLQHILAPDLDINDDGEADWLSVALRFGAVPATIVP